LVCQAKTNHSNSKIYNHEKSYFHPFGITLPILAISLISYGQVTHTGLRFTDNISSEETSTAKAATSVNSKALKNFARLYKDVANEKWYNVHDGQVAMFTANGVDNRVAYDKKGNWVNTIRTYGESNLPGDVRHAVKSNYYDYNINLVQEIETPYNPTTYLIQLIGKTEIISLRMCEGEISVLKRYNKSE
jgi:hypothetical protein